jgi:hypothetical protein
MKIYFAASAGVREDDVDASHALWLVRLNVAFFTRAEAEAAGRLRRTETVVSTSS